MSDYMMSANEYRIIELVNDEFGDVSAAMKLFGLLGGRGVFEGRPLVKVCQVLYEEDWADEWETLNVLFSFEKVRKRFSMIVKSREAWELLEAMLANSLDLME